jgi:hypothetical protein
VVRRRYAIDASYILGWFSRVFSNRPCVPPDKLEVTIAGNALTKRGPLECIASNIG